MIVAGVVAGASAGGKELSDGATALMIDGSLLVAVSEERIAKRKAAGGWRLSLAYCLQAAGLSNEDVDFVGISSCCDAVSDLHPESAQIGAILPRARIIRVPHHASHAWYSYLTSPFDECLVAVADAGGNTVSSPQPGSWWSSSREQLSWFVASKFGLELVDRDFDLPHAAGFGECFRAVTHFLGWPSGRFASKTMALAAYGTASHLPLPPAFAVADNGHLKSLFENSPPDPVQMCTSVLEDHGVSVAPRYSGQVIRRAHCDLAAWIQDSLQDAWIQRSTTIMQRNHTDCLSLGGGVALNCKANAALAQALGLGRVFVPAAPGDTGQAIGNTLHVLHDTGVMQTVDRQSIRRPFLGQELSAPGRETLRSEGYRVTSLNSMTAVRLCDLVDSGLLVGCIRGPSEFGPRALGGRSIFADPRIPGSGWSLNLRKGRESFMPFAASVLMERLLNYFPDGAVSPYMQFAWEGDPEIRGEIPAVIHADGSSRLQTVGHSANDQWLRYVLTAAEDRLGVPMILNTSLNGRGQPIAESAADALALLDERVIDALLIEDNLVEVPV